MILTVTLFNSIIAKLTTLLHSLFGHKFVIMSYMKPLGAITKPHIIIEIEF